MSTTRIGLGQQSDHEPLRLFGGYLVAERSGMLPIGDDGRDGQSGVAQWSKSIGSLHGPHSHNRVSDERELRTVRGPAVDVECALPTQQSIALDGRGPVVGGNQLDLNLKVGRMAQGS